MSNAATPSLPARFVAALLVPFMGIYFTFTFVGGLIDDKSPAVLILSLAGLAFVVPPVRRKIATAILRSPNSIEGLRLVALLLVIMLLQGAFIGGATRRVQPSIAAEATTNERTQKRAADLAHFISFRQDVMAEVAKQAKAAQHQAVVDLARRFDPKNQDAEMRAARNTAYAALARASLANEATMSLSQRASAYRDIALAEPSNKKLVAKAATLTAQDRRERDARERVAAALRAKSKRTAMLERQFSKWDGSHRSVEQLAKRCMKNPDSYEHVETRYIDLGEAMRVTTVFRGTNSFGAVVPSKFVATVADDGRVISIEEGC